MSDDDAPKLHIDSDWKSQAQAEKQKLAEATKTAQAPASGGGQSASPSGAGAKAAGGNPGGREMPPANFETLVSTMATQALFSMGAIPDPRTGQRHAQLELARHHIDMLSVIEEKTNGNLSDDEQSMLAGTLYELRSRYIQVSNQARER